MVNLVADEVRSELLPDLKFVVEDHHTIPDWTDVPTEMKNFPFAKINELLVPLPGNNEPIDYFRMIFDDEILNLIVCETNHYAEELFCLKGVSEKSRITRWKPVTCEEILTFFALVIHTGTIKLNRLTDYWKTHPLFNLTCFSAHMGRDRFLIIMQCLHFARNPIEGDKSHDRLYKIRPILDFFNKKMARIYYPKKELTIEESMVLWRRRLVFRRYVNNKTNKYGINLYMLTEADGAILNLSVYTGALDNKGHTSYVVLDLLNEYLDSGHSVYLDNFYNSFELADNLTRRDTYCTGILNFKRKNNPKDLLAIKLKNDQTDARYSHSITIGKWKNKREIEVLYISNEFNNRIIEYANNKKKPAPIFHYNKHLGRVDHKDQINSYNACERTELRWYKKLGLHFIQLMLLNSYYLHQKYSHDKLSFYKFRLSVLEKLLHIDQANIIVKRERDVTRHIPTKISTTNKKGETSRKRCRVCSRHKIRKSTLYHCERCDSKPGLCVGECFELFHS